MVPTLRVGAIKSDQGSTNKKPPHRVRPNKIGRTERSELRRMRGLEKSGAIPLRCIGALRFWLPTGPESPQATIITPLASPRTAAVVSPAALGENAA